MIMFYSEKVYLNFKNTMYKYLCVQSFVLIIIRYDF